MILTVIDIVLCIKDKSRRMDLYQEKFFKFIVIILQFDHTTALSTV